MTKGMTPEDMKIEHQNEELYQFVHSDAWGIIKGKFNRKILDLGNILTIEGGDVVKEIGARQLAIQVLFDLMKEVEGDAEQHLASKENMQKILEEQYINRN